MEDCIFQAYLSDCRFVSESTACLEMFSYSDSRLNSIQESVLEANEFNDFLQRTVGRFISNSHSCSLLVKGRFSPATLPNGVSLLSGIRLIVQLNAQHPDTFAPATISLEPDAYASMMECMRLSKLALQCTSNIDPLFWSGWDQNEESPNFQIIYRKANVRRKGKTYGFEIISSHDLHTSITSGFCKGTPSSNLDTCLGLLKTCMADISHPMLLPILGYGFELKPVQLKQQAARDWLRRIEFSMSPAGQSQNPEDYPAGDIHRLMALSRDVTECYSHVLWKSPESYVRVLDSMKEAVINFNEKLPAHRQVAIRKLNASILSNIELHRRQWQGIETYASTSMKRLELQGTVLSHIFNENDNKLNVMMAAIAEQTKRDAIAMKTLAFIGTVFLPGSYIASIFSTTFFNFQNDSTPSVISPRFWIYWAVTIPVTLVIVGSWYILDTRRAKRNGSSSEYEMGNLG